MCAHDEDVLRSLRKAVQEKIVKPVLIGKTKEIKEILGKYSLELNAEIIECEYRRQSINGYQPEVDIGHHE